MMSPKVQEDCKLRILRYQKTRNPKIQSLLRNELFAVMEPFMFLWLKNVLGKWNYYVDETLLLSWSWSAFELALSKYKSPFKIAAHFHKYTVFYLKREVLGQSEKDLTIEFVEDITEILEKQPTVHFQSVMEKLLTIKEFRSSLNNSYKIVFDDALLSMNEHQIRNQNRSKIAGISTDRYYEAKKIMKIVISFLLGENKT